MTLKSMSLTESKNERKKNRGQEKSDKMLSPPLLLLQLGSALPEENKVASDERKGERR